MKTKSGRSFGFFALFAWLVFAAINAPGNVSFSVTPTTISNTYAGTITFQVTGLTNSETVVVQKYLDVNGNGVIDTNDILWQQFKLTDGQAGMVIGGVTNFLVPGDTDGLANGQITAWFYPQVDFAQILTAGYLYKLSSPVGHFTPLTNSFAVTSFPYPQKLTGTVLSNGVALPYANVILFPGSANNQPVGGALANAAGVYSIPAAPGSYQLVAFKTNFVANGEGAAGLALASGATLSTNLSLTPATTAIYGRVVDATNSNLGIPGLLIPVQTKTGLLAIGFTDTNGNFSTGVTASQWKIGGNTASLAVHGYVGLQNKTNVSTATGSVTGVTISLPRATALIYGAVKDNLGHPLPVEAAVGGEDQPANLYQTDGYTDTNGNYVTPIIGGLGTSDTWQIGIDNASSLPDYIFSQPAFDQNGGTNVAAGAAVPASFTAILATNYITGNVKFEGTNLVGVGVYAYTTINNMNYSVNNVDTDTNGNYSLTVANGAWSVNVYDCGCSDGDSLNNVLAGVSYQDPAPDSITISSKNATANFAVPSGSASGQIFGYVTDTDGNPVTNVNVDVSDSETSYSTSTAANGYYSFSLAGGTWQVSVDCDTLMSLGYECPSNQTATVNGGSDQVNFLVSFASTGPLQITTSTLPDGIAGTVYDEQLEASGGESPYTWSLTPGSLPLPLGFTLATAGVLTGSPTNIPFGGATNYFSVRVTDHLLNTYDQLLSLILYPALTIATNALPNGTVGTPYSAQVLVSGGDPMYSGSNPDGYFASFSGSLPTGLNFSYGSVTSSNQFFVISGTPTTTGTYPFTMGAYDNIGDGVQANYSITIVAASVQITTTSLTNATVSAPYTNQLSASGGATPYTWAIALGSQPLPPTLTLSTNGVIAGVPTASGTNYFIVRVTDHNALTTTHTFTLVTNPRPQLTAEKISGAKFQFLLTGAAGQNYTLQLSTNLLSPNWTSLLITNSPTTNAFIVADPNATNQQRYYRVLVGP